MTKSSKFDFLANNRQAENAAPKEEHNSKEDIQISESLSTHNSENPEAQKSENSKTQNIITPSSSSPPPPSPEIQPPKRRGRPPGKRSNPDYEQVTAYIRSDTYKLVKKGLLDDPQSRDFSTLLEELLADWLCKQTN